MPSNLAALAFIDAWPGVFAASHEELQSALERLCADGAAKWPDIPVSAEAMARFVAPRVPSDAEPAAYLGRLSGAGLSLACQCNAGSSQAAALFTEHMMATIRRAARRNPSQEPEDLMQNVFRDLFVPEPGRIAKITAYRGEGDLRTWVGVVATRTAINAGRRRAILDEPIVDRWAQTVQSPEFEHLREVFKHDFRAAFSTAIARLSVRDRNVLRFHLRGLTAAQIGRIHGAHRVTIARWISNIRAELLASTVAILREGLVGDPDEIDRVVGMIDSKISLSIERLLPSGSDNGG